MQAWKLRHQSLHHAAIDIDGGQQLRLRNELAGRVSNVDRSGTEQQRLAPRRERRDIGGVLCHHRGQVAERPQFYKWDFEIELDFCQRTYSVGDHLAHWLRWTNEADENLGGGVIGN